MKRREFLAMAANVGKGSAPFLLLVTFLLTASCLFYALEHYEANSNATRTDLPCFQCVEFPPDPSFSTAFYFVCTIVSSIGYGDVVACTWYGKLLTMIVACTLVPFTLYCLGRLGRLNAAMANNLWHQLCLRLFKERHRDRREETLPLSLGIGVAAAWILISSVFFHFCSIKSYSLTKSYTNGTINYQSWTYFDSVYFAVISLLTIGFGDYSPTEHAFDPLTFVFIFVGLALVSMCVALAQKQMENQFDRVLSLIQQIYQQQETWQIDGEASKTEQNMTSADQKVAKVVLELWNRDPTGGWLHPLMSGGTEKKAALWPGMKEGSSVASSRIGPTTQKMMVKKWRQKALQRSVATQTLAVPQTPVSQHSGSISSLVCCAKSSTVDAAGSVSRPKSGITLCETRMSRNSSTNRELISDLKRRLSDLLGPVEGAKSSDTIELSNYMPPR